MTWTQACVHDSQQRQNQVCVAHLKQSILRGHGHHGIFCRDREIEHDAHTVHQRGTVRDKVLRRRNSEQRADCCQLGGRHDGVGALRDHMDCGGNHVAIGQGPGWRRLCLQPCMPNLQAQASRAIAIHYCAVYQMHMESAVSSQLFWSANAFGGCLHPCQVPSRDVGDGQTCAVWLRANSGVRSGVPWVSLPVSLL